MADDIEGPRHYLAQDTINLQGQSDDEAIAP